MNRTIFVYQRVTGRVANLEKEYIDIDRLINKYIIKNIHILPTRY